MKQTRRTAAPPIRRGLSMLLTALLLAQLLTPAALAAGEAVPLAAQRISREQLPEGNCIYFGAAAASLPEEDGTWSVPIYREGDLSGEASVILRSLDLAAVYGTDYTLLLAGVRETGDGLSMLERGAASGTLSVAPSGEGQEAAALSGEDAQAAEPADQAALQEAGGELVAEGMAALPYSSQTTVTFAPGEDEKTVTFRILDDREAEGTEGFTLVLTDPAGAELFSVTSLSVSIEDNEPAEYSVLSFSQADYASSGGVVTVRVLREGALYAPCTVTLSTAEGTARSGVNYQERNETLTFMPYETEKELAIPVSGKGTFSLFLREFHGAQPGACSEAEISVDEPPAAASYALTDSRQETASLASDGEGSFGISIGGRDFTVRYDTNSLARSGRIMDTAYDPELEVGVYHFTIPTDRGGTFTYGIKNDDDDYAQYRISNYPDAQSGRTYLYWFHGRPKKTGKSYTNGTLPNILYYQLVSPDWAVDANYTGYQYVGLNVDGENYGMSGGYGGCEFGRTQNNRVVSFKDDPRTTNRSFDVYAASEDCEKWHVPSTEMDLYGFCCLYKKFRVTLGTPQKLEYRTAGGKIWEDPIQIYLDSGAASPVPGDKARIFYVNPRDPAVIIPTFSDSILNGVSAHYGHVKEYLLTFTDNDNHSFTLNYPSCVSGARYQADLSRIILDEQMLSLIERTAVEKGVRNLSDAAGSDKEFHRDMTITPVYAYDDVSVTVERCEHGSAFFTGEDFTPGEHTFHAGDLLFLNVEIPESEREQYRVVGYEVREDGARDYNVITSTNSLFLTSGKHYTIRPAVAEIGNQIELRLTDNAKDHLTVLNTIPADDLKEEEEYAGKTVLDLNPKAKDLHDRMRPVPGQVYTVSFLEKEASDTAKETGDTAKEDSDTVYLPVIRRGTDTKVYTTNVFYMTAMARASDNVLEVDVAEVSKSELVSYTLTGCLTSSSRPIRYSGIEKANLPVSGYSVTAGTGSQAGEGDKAYPNIAGALSGGDGGFTLTGILGKKDDIITVHVSNGSGVSQVLPVTLGDAPEQNIGEQTLPYPASAPKILSLSYSYAKNNGSVNNNDNQLPILDDQVTFTASVDSTEISKAVFTRHTRVEAGGQSATENVEYTVTPLTDSNGSLLTFQINNLIKDQVKNGDTLTVRLYSGEGETAVVYPEVDTGLSFYSRNELTPPQTYSFDGNQAINIPILGTATGVGQSGLLSFGRLDWPDKTGFTLMVNLDPAFTSARTTNTKDKLDALNKLEATAKAGGNAESAIFELHGKKSPGNDLKEETKLSESIAKSGHDAKDPKAGLKLGSPSDFNVESFTATGAIVIAFDFLLDPESNQYIFCSGTVGIGGTLSCSRTVYTVVYGVPVFLNFTGTIQINCMVYYPTEEGKNAITADEFNQYAGNLANRLKSASNKNVLLIGGKLQAGTGMYGVLSTRGYVSLTLQEDITVANAEAAWGGLLTAVGGIGIDLLLFSINLDAAAVTLGYGTLEGATEFEFFGGMVNPDLFSAAPASGQDAALQAGDEALTLQPYDAGSADLSLFGQYRTSTPKAEHISILLDNAAERTRPQIIPLGDGSRMLLFLANRGGDSACGNETVLCYVTGDEENGWGTPAFVADDGTADSTPALLPLAGGRVAIAWADAERTFTESDTRLDKLRCMGISLAIFDPDTGTMSDEIALARDDGTFDLSPRLNVFGDNVCVSFVRRGLSGYDTDADLTDLSRMTTQVEYRVYDTNDKTIVSREVPLRTEETAEPLTLDYDAETMALEGTDYMLSSYTADLDGDLNTHDDHALYLGIDDLSAGQSFFPIRIRQAAAIAAPRLTAACGEVFLTWVENGSALCLLNVSGLLGEMFAPEDFDADDGVSFLSAAPVRAAFENADKTKAGWEKQSAEALGLDELRYHNSLYEQLADGALEPQTALLGSTADTAQGVTDYVTASDGRDLYFFFTRMSDDPNSAGTDICGLRYRHGESELGGFGKEVRITENRKNYVIDELALFMDANGSAHGVCNYYQQSIEVLEDPASSTGYRSRMVYSPNALAAVDFVSRGSLTIPEESVLFPSSCIAGQQESVSFDVYNGGLMDAAGYRVTVTDVGGAALYDETFPEPLGAGETRTVQMPWTVPEGSAGGQLTFTVTEAGVSADAEASLSVPVPNEANLLISGAEVGRGEDGFLYTAVLQNTGAAPAGALTLELSAVRGDGNEQAKVLASSSAKALSSGDLEKIELPFPAALDDLSDLGTVTLRLLVRDDRGNEAEHYTRLTLSKPVLAELDGGAESLSLKTGETHTLEARVGPWSGLAGEAQYSSADSSVASVDRDGVVRGVSQGSTTVSVYYPACGVSDEILVSVSSGGSGGGSGGSGGGGSGSSGTSPAVPVPAGSEPDPMAAIAACPKDDSCPLSRFSDTDPAAWYHDGVHYVLEAGIMNGMGGGRFAPNAATTRAMMAQILWNLEGRPAGTDALPYEDVGPEDWYAPAIGWAMSEGIMQGYSDTRFGPNDPMTREQLVTIMYRYAGSKGADTGAGQELDGYTDAGAVSTWALPAMEWAVASGLVRGKTDTTLAPVDQATRAEIAAMMSRYLTESGKPSA